VDVLLDKFVEVVTPFVSGDMKQLVMNDDLEVKRFLNELYNREGGKHIDELYN
jgi:hypothetical protein